MALLFKDLNSSAYFAVFLKMSVISALFDIGKPRRTQLAITDIFNVLDALRQRGFVNPSEKSIEETLLCTPGFNFNSYNNVQACNQRDLDFLNSLNEKRFRDKLREIIFQSDDYGSLEQELLGLKFKDNEATRKQYGKTIELLLAYLSVKELGRTHLALATMKSLLLQKFPDLACSTCRMNCIVISCIRSTTGVDGNERRKKVYEVAAIAIQESLPGKQ